MRCRKQHLATSEKPRSLTPEHRACSRERRLCWHHRTQRPLPVKGLGSSPHFTAEETGWLPWLWCVPHLSSALEAGASALSFHAVIKRFRGVVYAEVLCTP